MSPPNSSTLSSTMNKLTSALNLRICNLLVSERPSSIRLSLIGHCDARLRHTLSLTSTAKQPTAFLAESLNSNIIAGVIIASAQNSNLGLSIMRLPNIPDIKTPTSMVVHSKHIVFSTKVRCGPHRSRFIGSCPRFREASRCFVNTCADNRVSVGPPEPDLGKGSYDPHIVSSAHIEPKRQLPR